MSDKSNTPVDLIRSDGSVVLPERFDLRSCGDVLAALKRLDGEVVLDAADVEVMTSPAFQVLLSAIRDGVRVLRVVEPSKAFRDCLTLLGGSEDMLAGQSEGAA